MTAPTLPSAADARLPGRPGWLHPRDLVKNVHKGGTGSHGPGVVVAARKGERVVLLGLGLALGLLATLAVGAFAQACTNPGFATNGLVGPNDMDRDGFNDSGAVDLIYPGNEPNASAITVHASLEYLNGTPINSSVSTGPVYLSFADTTYVYTNVLMDPSSEPGTVVLRATMDEGLGVCDWKNLTFFAYPPGRYEPTLDATTTAAQVDEDAAVTYQVRVGSLGNLPDILNLTLTSSLGWNVQVSPDNVSLGPGNFTTVNVTVRAPHNAPPLAAETTWLNASSFRKAAPNATLVLSTAVKAQVFAPQLSSSAPSLTTPPGTSARFNITVTNAGNNRDVVTVAAPAAPTGWAVALSATSFPLDAGGSANFSVNVSVPTALTGLLVWSPMLTATGGDGTTTGTLGIEARLELADFALASADISVSVAHPPSGTAVSVIVTVRNLGLATSADVVVSLSDGATNQTRTVSIGPSGSEVATFSWTALPGTTTLTATADASHSIPEANEANNAASVTVVADAPPTAVAANATASGEPGKALTISAAGSTDADGTVAAYYFDFGDGANSDWVTTSTVAHTYAAAGTYTVKIRVRDNAGAESANATSTVAITAPAPAGKGFLPGFEASFALAVVGGLGAVAGRRRKR